MTTGKNRIMISRAMSGSVLGGDHTFGAFALALVVRPVPGRALLLGGKLGFELLILAFSVATTSVTGWPRGDLAGNGLCGSSSRSIATRVLPSLACERGRRLRLTMARAPSDEILRRSPICA